MYYCMVWSNIPLEQSITLRSHCQAECVRVFNPTFHSPLCTHWAKFSRVGADASQGWWCVCLSRVIWTLLLCCSVVRCGVKGTGAGSGVFRGIIIGHTVLGVRQRFCFKKGWERYSRPCEHKEEMCRNVRKCRNYAHSHKVTDLCKRRICSWMMAVKGFK